MKTTLRLPDDLADELRRISRKEGRSMNSTLIETLRRGLGQEPEDSTLRSILGDFISRPARKRFDPAAFQAGLPELTREQKIGIEESLEWAREDRF